ncbi:MAG: 30S ribosomal protein S19e [Halobacteriales archaeon]|nr:30S ribosomal protein S19e [Halobacteriales archaeon]
MVTLYDVPVDAFLSTLAETLSKQIEPPEWSEFAKSGPDRELPPEQDNFWFVRAASILRIVAIEGPIGVERLSSIYGGGKAGSTRYRVGPVHHVSGSGKIIRTILQQLETAGLLEKPPNSIGRVVSPQGQSLLDKTAGEVLKTLNRDDLNRYI